MTFLQKPYLLGDSGPTQQDLSISITQDVTYTESGGLLVGSNGAIAGWGVNQFAKFTHIKDDISNNRIEFKLNATGQLRCDILNSWPTDAPYIYLPDDIQDDFDIIIECDVATGGDLDKSIVIAVGYPDDDDKTYDHLCAIQWGAWNSTNGKMEMVMSRPGTSPVGFTYDTVAYGTNRFLRLTRTAKTIRWRWASDSEGPWTELNVAGGREIDLCGAEGRLMIGFGCNASPSTDTFYIYSMSGTYYAVE